MKMIVFILTPVVDENDGRLIKFVVGHDKMITGMLLVNCADLGGDFLSDTYT